MSKMHENFKTALKIHNDHNFAHEPQHKDQIPANYCESIVCAAPKSVVFLFKITTYT